MLTLKPHSHSLDISKTMSKNVYPKYNLFTLYVLYRDVSVKPKDPLSINNSQFTRPKIVSNISTFIFYIQMWVSTSLALLMWFTFSLPYGPFVFVHKLLLFMGTCFFLADLQLLLLSNRGKGSYYYLSALSNKRGKLSEVEYHSLSKLSFFFAYGYGKNK